MRFLFASIIIISFHTTTAKAQNDGYAVIKSDTIYGEIRINFDGGSLIVKQDSVNRMFFRDIEVVTILNESRDTYYTFVIDGKNTFYKAVIPGEHPLIEKDGALLCVFEDYPTVIEEKTLYSIFGKKEVKDYVFVRNISIEDREGLLDLFGHFNHFSD